MENFLPSYRIGDSVTSFLSWDIPTLAYFKDFAIHAHHFGLGFIQIKLSDTERWHFYSTRIAKFSPEEEVHNHRYSFISQIMAGELRSDFWEVDNGETHELYRVSCKPGESDELVGPCTITHSAQIQTARKSSYWLDRDTFHQVSSEFAITRLTRANERRERAFVVREKGRSSVCPFGSKMPDEELWECVAACLRVASRSSSRAS